MNEADQSIPDQSMPTDPESLRAMYSENAQVARAFFEWRHKVISLYLLSVAAIFFLAGWLHDHATLRKFLFVPFVLGTIISCMLALMDRVNAKILRYSYRIGKDIETEMRSTKGGIYAAFCSNRSLTNYRILSVVYWGSAVIFILVALAVVRWPLK